MSARLNISHLGVICSCDLCTTSASLNSLIKLFNRTAQYDFHCFVWHGEHYLPSYLQVVGRYCANTLLVSRFILSRVLHPHNLLDLNFSSFTSSALNVPSSEKLSFPESFGLLCRDNRLPCMLFCSLLPCLSSQSS